MNIEEFDKKDMLGDFEYELNKLCRSCIGTATEIQIKQQPLINLFEELVWAYEKEKEKNKEILLGNIENFQKYFLEEFNKKFISIDKLKEIVDECIPKKENIITRELEYTPNANANSYLTQEILSLLKEE